MTSDSSVTSAPSSPPPLPHVSSETNLVVLALFQMSSAAPSSPAPASTPSTPTTPATPLLASVAASPVTSPDIAALCSHDTGSVAYSPEVRKERVRRYLEKKRARRSGEAKTIRYVVRKKLADVRPRVRGRFSKPVQPDTAASLAPPPASGAA
mmetsp:Transcript_20178/g.53786  ORF Transcript_20178/g.53786 Transcript_20178/m.53786 type:complete len:153 (+) Transcript_20178:100-558(+)|eukprot:CAMPEP_0174895450 /NCGR_PEP_ID=MMETSP0167-20121228/9862_1 /TAXON_ID=38298 /ORGANISM="Rhodella maculata, Strain CCMP736" /LENGTH=152 /DNA_ID=CAMNT_0016134785 /DNA_START=35 /DNA_END=493 /DNA_ORIENTATION=-